jgi:hypothetical protein
MVENIAEYHREILATLKLGQDGVVRKKKRGGLVFEDETSVMMASSETFGAQAITEIGATLGEAFRNQHEGKNIDNLVSAIATAKESNLDHLVPQLEKKLEKLLGAEAPNEEGPVDEPPAPEEEPS